MERFKKYLILRFTMKFLSEDRFIYDMRVERWVVNGSLDDVIELKMVPDHSKLRVKARIEKLPDGSYRTRRVIYARGGKRTQDTYYSPNSIRAMDDFLRRIDNLVAISIDGLTNDPKLLKIHEKYKLK